MFFPLLLMNTSAFLNAHRHKVPFITFVLTLPLLFSACISLSVETLIQKHIKRDVSPKDFIICRDYGCYRKIRIGLSDKEWDQIRALFKNPSKTAAQERQKIARAISRIEKLVGPKAGISEKLISTPIFFKAKWGQMDCIDEAYNTTLYLTLLKQDGLITFHKVGQPLRRGYLMNCLPHHTATIIEQKTGKQFAVDSYFHANGDPPEIVPAEKWLSCWDPIK